MMNQTASLFALTLVLAGCGTMVTYVPDPGDTGAELGALAGTGAGELDADGCTPPGLWDFGSQGPSAGGFAPVYVGVSLWGILEQDDVVDYAIDGDEYSAALIFDFFDGSGVPLCSALFDASESAVPSHDGWVTDSGGTVWEGYAFSLDADAAFTDCAQLDGSLGYQDVRAWAADRSWRIGVGEMTAGLRSSLQSAIDASLGAGTWSGDWDPYVVAQYVDVGGPKAVESGYGMVYSHECYGIDSDGTGSLRPEASLTAGPVDGLLGNAGSWVIMPMAQLP